MYRGLWLIRVASLKPHLFVLRIDTLCLRRLLVYDETQPFVRRSGTNPSFFSGIMEWKVYIRDSLTARKAVCKYTLR